LTNIRHKPSKRQKRHLREVAAGLAPPTITHQRFSSRRKANAVTYNEDSDLGEYDDREWDYVEVEADNTPYIDVILGFRLPEGRSLTDDKLGKEDFEYWVKWTGQAHVHATWNTYDELKDLRGNRKIFNYFQKVLAYLIYYETDKSAPAEDKEMFIMKYGQQIEEYENNQKIERVIATRDGEIGTQYLVKWQGLLYDSATWEEADFVSEMSQQAIDDYLNRSQRLPSSDKKHFWSPNYTDTHTFMNKQPSYVQCGQLREFQLLGLNYLCMNWCKRKNVIIADEMGLGKTVQTVSFVSWLIHQKRQEGPHLIVVPLSTLPAWMDTFAKWTPDVNAVAYHGSSASRSIAQEHELLLYGDSRKPKFNVLVTTYENINIDPFLSSISWQFLAVDEAHRLKNRESVLYKALVAYNVPAKLLITGTPMQNSIEELSALLDFLNPGVVEAPENIDDLPPEEGAKILAEFKEIIRPYMLRRVKTEVEKDLPPKTEKILRVELSSLQLEYYQNILTRNYAALNAGSNGHRQSLLNIMMELKKCSNHPFLFPGAEDRVLQGSTSREDQLRAITTSSGKMMLLDKLLTKVREENHRVLIFTQLVSMLNILNDYLQMKGYKFQRLDGTISSTNRRQAIDRFNHPDSEDFAFILSTRAGGLGINLATADTIVLFDSDWNPHLDIQAMARAHRIGQTKPVTVFRFVSSDTIEEEILERARNKLVLEFLLIQRGADEEESKVHRRALTAATEAPQSAQDITEILKRRSQKMFESSDNQKRLEELDINSIIATAEEHQTQDASAIKSSDGGFDFMQAMITSVKFEGGWDEIIPKEKIAELEEEEARRKEEEFLKKLQEENKPRKRKPTSSEKEQREAKKRARKSTAAMAAMAAESDDDDDDDKSNGSDDDSDTNKDPKRPLSPKEWRNLIRSCEKYGSFADYDAQQKIVKDGRLTGRDLGVLQAAYDEVVQLCNTKIDESGKMVEEEEKAGKKQPTKKEKKAILLEHHGVKRINCETFLERATDMQMVRELVANTQHVRGFRVPEATKAAHYTCAWGAREDGMLVVGLARHGFGGWSAMQADTDLDLNDKFFLEENRAETKKQRGEAESSKSPGAVHLVRRANYLLSVLRDKQAMAAGTSARRTAENHHRPSKKAPRDRVHTLKSEGTSTGGAAINGSASPRPKIERPRSSSNVDSRMSVERPSSRQSNESSGFRRKHDGDDEDRDSKRRRLSNESHEGRPFKNGTHKEDRERAKKIEKRRYDRQNALNPSPEKRRDRDSERHSYHRRDRDLTSRDRSRSPRRDRHDNFRDRGDRDRERNGRPNPYRDERRDYRREGRHDQPRRRDDDRRQDREHARPRGDSFDRPVSRDGSLIQRSDRDRHDRYDKYHGDHRNRDRPREHKHDRSHYDDRHSGHHGERHKDHKHSHEKKYDVSRCSAHFEQNGPEILRAVRTGMTAAYDKSLSKEDRTRPMRRAMADIHRFIEKTGGESGDSSRLSKMDLW
jgi:chromodomain-helicase-DNA-binding protein 1